MSLACIWKERDKTELLSPSEHDVPAYLLSPDMEMTMCPQKAEEMHLCEEAVFFPLLCWQSISYSRSCAFWEEIWSQ